MGTVTPTFARALARAAGLTLADDGALMRGDTVVRQVRVTDGRLSDQDYFDLVDWVGRNHADRTGLPFRYAEAVDIDNLGALGLAMKTAPTLRDSLLRAERYFRLLTTTVSYSLDESEDPALFTLHQQTEAHPALDLRNECALCGFGRIFRQFVGPDLAYHFVAFRHSAPADADRFAAFFGCPVQFGAAYNAIALPADMLGRPTRLGDAAVSRFLTAHLDAELGGLPQDESCERTLAAYLSEALSNGIPTAGAAARAVGMSERTLYRRLAETGQTYQDVLESTQRALAETLLSKGSFSIAEVAFLTGFSEQSSFSRAFKRWFGQSPGAWRRTTLPA